MKYSNSKNTKTFEGTADLIIGGNKEYDVPVYVKVGPRGGICGVEMRGYYVPAYGPQLQHHDIIRASKVDSVSLNEEEEDNGGEE